MYTALFTSLHKLLTTGISWEKLYHIELVYNDQTTRY